MTFTDPIGDMFSRIRNGQMRSLNHVEIPSSNFRKNILEILKNEGYIKDYQLDNIINMIESLGLNTNHSKYSYSKLKKYMASDKKVKDGKLNLILIDKKFNAFKTSKYNIKNITNALN